MNEEADKKKETVEDKVVESIDADSSEHEPGQEPVRSSYRLLYVIAILILLVIGFIYTPAPVKDRISEQVIDFIRQSNIVETPAPAPSTPVTANRPATEKTKPEAPVKKSPPPPAQPIIISASSEEVNRLLAAVNKLDGEIGTLRQQQKALEELQHSVQRMQLRTRLQWITDPASHLPQIRLAWEEVSLMPAISSDERETALKMLNIATVRLAEVRKWQNILIEQAEPLAIHRQQNILPKFDNEWIDWIAAQFSLKPSLSESQAAELSLRNQIVAVGRNLEIEYWPEERAWLQLRSKMQLRSSSVDGDHTGPLELPESFSEIDADMELLRQSALEWQERLQ